MKHLLTYLFAFCALAGNAQKEDYVWLAGYRGIVGNFAGYDSACNCVYGHSIVDFNYTPRHIYYDSLHMNWDATNVSVCDTNGDLLFYSNGIHIGNAINVKIENSDSLNFGAIVESNPSILQLGHVSAHGMLAIRKPSSSDDYYILHVFLDTIPLPNDDSPIGQDLWLTTLDMSENAGLGKVIYKNQPLLNATNISFDVVATRHGNGRDWWTVVNKRNSNCYYKILATANGVAFVDTSCENVYVEYNNASSSTFSPDGSRYAMVTYQEGLIVFDFNRCDGSMGNSKHIPMPFLVDSGWAGLGISFSPNSRYLYVCATKMVLQYDMWALDIAASVDTVAVYDGYKSPFGSYFVTAQLAPDGKIYISCGNGEDVYHVINRPDEKGDSCLFGQHAIQLPTFSGGVPNFPNYRLGALAGSPCDTLKPLMGLEATDRNENQIKVFPNPATNEVVVDYGFTDWGKGNVTLQTTNALGQVVHTQTLPLYSGFQKLNISPYPAGTYLITLLRDTQTIATIPLVKE